MIITVDLVTLKKGEFAFEIGVSDKGQYLPVRGIVHGRGTSAIQNEGRCWYDYNLCLSECKKLHEEYKQTITTI